MEHLKRYRYDIGQLFYTYCTRNDLTVMEHFSKPFNTYQELVDSLKGKTPEELGTNEVQIHSVSFYTVGSFTLKDGVLKLIRNGDGTRLK